MTTNVTIVEHDGKQLAVFSLNGIGYVAEVAIETKLPDGLNKQATIDYLMEDYEDGVE